MDGAWERALYNSWLLNIFSEQQKHKYVFISIFIPKFFDGISNFQDALHPKANGHKSCILFSYTTRDWSCESKILDKGPVPKKAKVASNNSQQLTF